MPLINLNKARAVFRSVGPKFGRKDHETPTTTGLMGMGEDHGPGVGAAIFFANQGFSRWWQLKLCFIFTPIPGEMIQFDEHMFQIGWNHQLDVVRFYFLVGEI